MSELLRQMNIPAALSAFVSQENTRPLDFTIVDGSVLLRDRYEASRHVKRSDFPDRTGLECFLNHTHFAFDGKRESLLRCLAYAAALKQGLASLADQRPFQVVVAVSDDCTVRFHEARPGESWLTDDLESYAGEAILVFDVSSA